MPDAASRIVMHSMTYMLPWRELFEQELTEKTEKTTNLR